MKISLSNLFNYFFVSGDSKQIKKSPQKSGTLTTTRGGGWAPPKSTPFLRLPLFIEVFIKHFWDDGNERPQKRGKWSLAEQLRSL